MDLIPGLPNDLVRHHCLFRLHCTQLSSMSSLSKAWKSVLQSREFWRHRKLLCDDKQLILFKCWSGNIYKLIILEPETSIWSELPPIPEFPNGVPETFNFVKASFKWGFVVMGAFHKAHNDKTSFCNKVFVFDYISAMWQRGADMPEGRLSVYRCTSDRDRMVYVLCEKGCLTECIMVYDVMKAEWTSRIKTGKHGGYCGMGSMHSMIYHSGKIHFSDDRWVQGGCLDDDKRVFNASTWTWDPPQFDFLDREGVGVCLSDDEEWYSYRYHGTLAIYEHSTWKDIVQEPKEPNERERFNFIITWKSKVLVIREKFEKEQTESSFQLEARVLDLKNLEWTTIDAPEELKGVEAGCNLEI